MASIAENTRATLSPTTPKKVLAAIHNIPRRMRSGTFRPQQQQTAQPRATGKENVPPGQETAAPPRPRRPAPLLPNSERWAAKDGRIIIKVWVPTTDDIWKVRVPADVGLAAFQAAVVAKIGFAVSFSAVMPDGCLRTVAEDDAFRRWVQGRVRDGRNTHLTAHRLELQ
ncbi:hypothetical protein OH77DRAFT_1393135 [Trametes cingulata]|nr:hypothetical protein OH77DRAFT_1393135 [Trametes cingulata]